MCSLLRIIRRIKRIEKIQLTKWGKGGGYKKRMSEIKIKKKKNITSNIININKIYRESQHSAADKKETK